jgi:hypothetical protein
MDRHESFFSSVKSKQPKKLPEFPAVQISRLSRSFAVKLSILESQVRPAHDLNPIDDWKIVD